MPASIEDDQPGFVREATVNCAAWRWVEWLLALPEWQQKILGLSEAGAQEHRRGLAFREGPVGDCIPDAARFERWCGGQRALGLLLPRSLRELVGWLVLRPSLPTLTERLPLRPPKDCIVIAAGPPVKRRRMQRAQHVALRRLRDGRESRNTRRREDEAFRRFLMTIDPRQEPLVFIDGLGPGQAWLKVGDSINTSATAAAVQDRFLPCASQIGYPPLGRVATQAYGLAGVEPPKLPISATARFDIHPGGFE
ncbi:MAG TPA: hypothetical protein VED41_04625 [Solirubrobacteraceae bacterium]|nr:hypothetical protein [Solirubrobacteraceae bacterium]